MINIKTTNQGINTGYDLKITNSEGQELKHVSAIDIRCRPDEVIIATIELPVIVDIGVVPEYYILHPVSGEHKRVKRVEFFDGEDLFSEEY